MLIINKIFFQIFNLIKVESIKADEPISGFSSSPAFKTFNLHGKIRTKTLNILLLFNLTVTV